MSRLTLLRRLSPVALVALCAHEAVAGPPSGFIYTFVHIHGSADRIEGYRFEPVTSGWTPLPGFPILTGGIGDFASDPSDMLAYDAANDRLYAANSESATLTAYAINRTSGTLTALPFSPVALGTGHWVSVAVHPSGSPVVVAARDGSIASFAVTATTATPAPGSPFTSGAPSISTRFSRDGTFVYTGGNDTGIAGFSVTPEDGALTPVPGSPFDAGAPFQFGYATDDAGRLVTVNRSPCAIRVFTTSSGALAGVTGNPFAAPFDECSHGVLHPAGFYIAGYVNKGLVGLHRIAGSGAATTATLISGSLRQTFGPTKALALSPDASLLVTANTGDINLAMFSVDASSESLTAIGALPSGTLGRGNPLGVAFVPARTLFDADADGRADLVWRNKATGQNIGWLMDGATLASSGFLPTVDDTNWETKGTGDFDGNGTADLIWRNKVTGQNVGWLMNGLTVAASAFLPTIADTNWEIKGVGDFNGDDKGDVILRNKVTGQNVAWLMNGTSVAFAAFLPTIADTNWEIVGVGDFDGNGKADVILRNPVTGENMAWLMNGASVAVSAFLPTIADTNWEGRGIGDIDRDGRADVVWRNTGTGENLAWLMDGASVKSSDFLPTIVTNWEIKLVRDVDGDNHADVVWRNKVTGENILWLMTGSASIKVAVFLSTIADINWEIQIP